MLFICLPEAYSGNVIVFLGCMDGLVAFGLACCTGTVARCAVIEIDSEWHGIKFLTTVTSYRN
jgi:hypothetical protein